MRTRKSKAISTDWNVPSRGAQVRSFLYNPQKEGAWALFLKPDASSIKALRKLLNLQDSYLWRHSRFEGEDGEPMQFSSTIPRLFAYLRFLVPKTDREGLARHALNDRDRFLRRGPSRRHWALSRLRELSSEPKKLSPAKKRSLSKAVGVFRKTFLGYSLSLVPEHPSAFDVASIRDDLYFQIEEHRDGLVVVYSLAEDIGLSLKELFSSLPGVALKTETRKVFSPESQLLGMYVPLLSLPSTQSLLREAVVQRTVSLALTEIREDRFVHAIRAVGIGAEELVVEVYETYLHQKAPEAPLGALLSQLNSKIQEFLGSPKTRKRSGASDARKTLGEAIKVERGKQRSNTQLCAVIDVVLNGIMPLLERMDTNLAELQDNADRSVRSLVFPSHVDRSLSDLVALRNRVSHRIDRMSRAPTVTYLDSALALKSYIVFALWWEEERRQIDYRVPEKDAIKQAIERAKTAE